MTESSEPQSQTQPSATSTGTVLGIAALICGILGLIPTFGILLALVGLILGWLARRYSRTDGNATGMTLGLIGMVLSSVTLVIATVIILFVGGMLGWFSYSASVGRFAGRFECHANQNVYEVRQDMFVVNGRTYRDMRIRAEGPDRLVFYDPAGVRGGITVESDIGWGAKINGRNCARVSN